MRLSLASFQISVNPITSCVGGRLDSNQIIPSKQFLRRLQSLISIIMRISESQTWDRSECTYVRVRTIVIPNLESLQKKGTFHAWALSTHISKVGGERGLSNLRPNSLSLHSPSTYLRLSEWSESEWGREIVATFVFSLRTNPRRFRRTCFSLTLSSPISFG